MLTFSVPYGFLRDERDPGRIHTMKCSFCMLPKPG
jgi:hypothetical protein